MGILFRTVAALCVPVVGLTRPEIDWIFWTSALVNTPVVWYCHVNADCRVYIQRAEWDWDISDRSGRNTGIGRRSIFTSVLVTSNNRLLIDIHFDKSYLKYVISYNM
jgi:hypothetical protein